MLQLRTCVNDRYEVSEDLEVPITPKQHVRRLRGLGPIQGSSASGHSVMHGYHARYEIGQTAAYLQLHTAHSPNNALSARNGAWTVHRWGLDCRRGPAPAAAAS